MIIIMIMMMMIKFFRKKKLKMKKQKKIKKYMHRTAIWHTFCEKMKHSLAVHNSEQEELNVYFISIFVELSLKLEK